MTRLLEGRETGWPSPNDGSIAGAGSVYLTHVQQGTSAQERNVFVDDLTLSERTG